MLSVTGPLSAQVWTAGTGNWFTGSNWNTSVVPGASSNVYINNGGTAQIASSGALSNNVYLGYIAANIGTVEVLGAGRWESIFLGIGENGKGTLKISGAGEVISEYAFVGSEGTGNGTVEISGGKWTSTSLDVGAGGTGKLLLSGTGEVISADSRIGSGFGSKGTVEVSGGKWTISDTLTLGYSGTGTLDISGKGVVEAQNGIVMAHMTDGSGTIVLRGDATSRGVLLTKSISTGFNPSGAKMTFNGGILRASANNTSFINGFDTGNVQIANGGAYIDTNGFNVTIRSVLQDAPGQLGFLVKQGTGTLTLTAVSTFLGGTTVEQGTLTLGNGTNPAALVVESYWSGRPVVTLSANTAFNVAINATVTGGIGSNSGGSGNEGAYGVVSGGAASLYNSGIIMGGQGGPGLFYGGAGGRGVSFTGGGTVANAGTISGGTGGLEDGGVQDGPGGIGVMLSGGGTLTNTGTISGGLGGVGLNQQFPFVYHASAVILGNNASLVNSGTVSGGLSGGNGSADGFAIYSDTGAVSVENEDGGIINGNIQLASEANTVTLHTGSTLNGNLNMGTSLGASLVLTGTSTDTQDYSAAVTGTTSLSGALTVVGGTWTLDEVLSHTGGTTVSGGALLVEVTLGAGDFAVKTGGTLGGSGTVGGSVTVTDGILAPGSSPGKLTIGGGLSLSSASILHFELGSPSGTAGVDSDLLVVGGALVLDGKLNITDAGGLEAGTYTLISYSGALSGSGLTLGTLRPAGYNFTVDTTTTTNAVLLNVDFDGLQFWDGGNTSKNDAVDGGAGTWNTSQTNWTSASGNWNTNWQNLTAVFKGTAGVVDLTENVTVLGLQFATDGYEISSSNSSTITLANVNSEVLVDTDVEVIISATFTGVGGLEKNGQGTLVLTGANTHTGDTTLNAGVLFANNSTGSATGTGNLQVKAGTLAGTGFISGNVTFNSAATLAPGYHGIGTLTIGSLVMRPDTVLEFDLGMPDVVGSGINDLLEVTGNLTLDGLLNITDAGGFDHGTYRLINYGGTLTNNGLVVNTLPAGVNPGALFVDLSTAGQVNLLFQLTDVQYWDGSNLQGNGRIDGGGGVWMAGATNWTNAQGLINGPWAGESTVFTAQPGTVMLGSDIPFEKLVFEVSGYRIESPSGYKLYSLGDATLQVNTGRATIAAPMVIDGSFFKTGGGLLDLRSSASAAATFIQSGSLAVNGTLQSPHVGVSHGGILQGTGLIIGNVFNSGTVAPGNSIGTLTIHGNYTQRSSGTLEIEVANTSHHDVLAVSGTAKLAGTLEVRSLGYHPKYGDQIPFLVARRITGKFSDIDMPNPDRFRGRFLNEGGVGVLLVAPTSYTLVARTGNEHNLAVALDEWIGIETGDIGGVTLALDLLKEEQYAQAFAAIGPAYIEGALSTATELSQSHTQMLHQQLSARRLANRIANVPATPVPVVSGKGAKAVAPQIAPAPDDARWSAWVQGSGLFSSGGLSLVPGEDFESGTILVGADYLVTEHLAVGLFASYQEGWGDYDFAGDIDVESVRFGAYATVDYDGFYANAAIGGGQTGFDMERPIQWATLNRVASSEPDGDEFFTSLGAGYDHKVGNWTFGPQLTLQYNKVSLDEFNETGAGVLNLHIHEAEMESLRSYLGGRIAYTLQVNERFAIIPEVRAFWQHEFLDGDEISSALDSGFGPDFTHETSGPDEDSIYIGAGIGFQIGARFYGNIYYNVDLGRHDEENHTVSISATLKF
ncbi:autotransporter domain-containing protein [Roseimicrobium gellanilyticum]|uniref:autotransporter domain-containing protein n=1 Tax=Roseimicrobium gellanilyticum TaxID=748857 RepID=UPI0014727BB9|nr:autotransporter domain-containing protein [Roseimicrobium gellanilyticum]